MTDLIDLQQAHVTQTTTEKNGKSAWMVRQNGTSADLFSLPGHLKESDVFTVLDFARKFELIALNAGILFQKDKQNSFLTERISLLTGTVEALKAENERLAAKLEQLIISGE